MPLRPLVGHLEKQQVRQLLDIVAVAHAVVAEDVAVVPELLNDSRWAHVEIGWTPDRLREGGAGVEDRYNNRRG